MSLTVLPRLPSQRASRAKTHPMGLAGHTSISRTRTVFGSDRVVCTGLEVPRETNGRRPSHKRMLRRLARERQSGAVPCSSILSVSVPRSGQARRGRTLAVQVRAGEEMGGAVDRLLYGAQGNYRKWESLCMVGIVLHTVKMLGEHGDLTHLCSLPSSIFPCHPRS
ncbi:hypothetical protein FKP32DRAFT_483482 [Trametes sanguinea]|nr:hypothetical protein FKP32DRAFT_483482 [Trametes sanguinea]